MSKKPNNTAARATSRAAPRGLAKTATKRPATSAKDATAERIASALEAIADHLSAASPRVSAPKSFGAADAFVWHPDGRLAPVPRVSRVDLGLLKGIDRMRDILIENTERFADGLPANNALLWGARDPLCGGVPGRRCQTFCRGFCKPSRRRLGGGASRCFVRLFRHFRCS